MWNLAAQRMKPEEVGESSRELHDQRCRKVFEDAVVKLNTGENL